MNQAFRRAMTLLTVLGMIGWTPRAWGAESHPTSRLGEPVKGLQLTLVTTQRRYVLGKPITISWWLRNVSDRPIQICRHAVWQEDFYRRMTPQPSEPQRLIEEGLIYRAEDFETLPPGGYRMHDWDVSVAGFIKEAGTWQMQITRAYAADGAPQGASAWTGTLTSNTVTIEVIAPAACQGKVDETQAEQLARAFWQKHYSVGPNDFTMGPPAVTDACTVWRVSAMSTQHQIPPLELEIDKQTGRVTDMPRE